MNVECGKCKNNYEIFKIEKMASGIMKVRNTEEGSFYELLYVDGEEKTISNCPKCKARNIHTLK